MAQEDFDDKVKGFSRLIDNPIVKYHFEEFCKRQGKMPAVKNIADCDVARRLFRNTKGMYCSLISGQWAVPLAVKE